MKRLPLPAEAFAQHAIALGKTGAGKSSMMRVIVEGLLDRERPVCILDPKGDWYGIKSSADGRSAGYPVVIFGGEHADVPIDERSGAHVAEIIASGNRPCLIDLGGWMVGERTRFFIRFAGAFFKHARGLRHLVIDEVHNFAPQGRIQDPDSGKMLHWANRLASEGRGRGITLLAASQRPQKVHKDFVTSCETLIAMRVIHKLDRNAVKDWIDGCADPDIGRQVLDQLAGMKRGEAWVWSPEIEFGPKRVTFPLFRTFDSFKPQAEAVELKGWADVDLEDVKVKLADVVAEAEANDPTALKRRIRELEQQALPHAVEASIREEGRRKGFEQGYLAAAAAVSAIMHSLIQRSNAFLEDLRDAARRLAQTVDESVPEAPAEPCATPAPRRETPGAAREARSSVRDRHSSARERANGELTAGMQRMLDALAWWEAVGVNEPPHTQLRFIAGYSARSGTFTEIRAKLKAAGLIDYGQATTFLTPAGRALAQKPDTHGSLEDLHRAIFDKLPGAQQRMLRELLRSYPDFVPNDVLRDRSGYSARSGTFTEVRADLKKMGLVEYSGAGTRATSLLFPKELR